VGTEPAETQEGPVILLVLVQRREVAIRTLGVGLVAIAAVAASLTFARYRGDQKQGGSQSPDDALALSAIGNLDAIRAAGL
jgi:hypothetical protein